MKPQRKKFWDLRHMLPSQSMNVPSEIIAPRIQPNGKPLGKYILGKVPDIDPHSTEGGVLRSTRILTLIS